jgi:hypothetical protein
VRYKNSFNEKHYAYTVKEMGWNGIKNGQLLHLLKENNFDAWIVVDKNIPYQQNVSNLPCLIIVLNVYRNTLIKASGSNYCCTALRNNMTSIRENKTDKGLLYSLIL